MADGAGTGVGGIERLPQDLLSRLISLTSPKDACRCSSVSTSFCGAAGADAVWSRFLPADIADVLDSVEDPAVQNCSKKELFRRLCDRPVLLKGGQMRFGLANWSGAKKFMLAARSLLIERADDQRIWRWYCHPESSFPEVAEFLQIGMPYIRCKIRGSMLSSNTAYAAYLIFKLPDVPYGINGGRLKIEMRTSIGINESVHAGRASLLKCANHECTSSTPWNKVQFPEARADGWMEVRIALFYNERDACLTLGAWALTEQFRRFILEGIEIRPVLESNDMGHVFSDRFIVEDKLSLALESNDFVKATVTFNPDGSITYAL